MKCEFPPQDCARSIFYINYYPVDYHHIHYDCSYCSYNDYYEYYYYYHLVYRQRSIFNVNFNPVNYYHIHYDYDFCSCYYYHPHLCDVFCYTFCNFDHSHYADHQAPADSRILVADSSEDGNPDGMTVEKCVALAKDGAWRYAGVEFGSQCFVGNTLHGPDQFPDSDCNIVCAGDPSELCGDAGRIQVYEDSTWSSPTLQELVDAVRQYNATVEEARSAIVAYQSHMKDLEDFLSSASIVKRSGSLESFRMEILNDDTVLKQVQAVEQNVRKNTQEVITKGRELDTISEDNPSVPTNIFITWNGTDGLGSQISQVRETLQRNADELQIAIDTNTSPQIDAAASVAEADSALKLIGLTVIGGLWLGSGFLYALAEIIHFFGGDTSPEPATTTTTIGTTSLPTGSATTTTSTTTCTATATTTPVGIITKQGTSLVEFNELVASLPQDSGSVQLTNSWQPNFLYLGEMDECTTGTLNNNPLVELWAIASDSPPLFVINQNGIPDCQA
ncbi:uncharacterized protein N7482_009444 [Penicillium canariense]|uniref:WSC domain-containing protein n=1 Tax=Penicillium canariense TaxID=189055 RepID=A0A9W9HNV4_9EURO|nr:uncharacterized protein N7482_009444 [Penicillium canariense]KAJ5152966.1 hypothetical protein N7482_009444 [Penicillium canariense]